MGRLQNKAILVTGSTTGIGKSIAEQCLKEGAQVLIHGLEADLAEATWNELDPEPRDRAQAALRILSR